MASAQELLSKRLQETGLADVAKAWIRATVARDLLSQPSAANSNKARPPRDAKDRLCDALVLDHLKARQLRYTESVLVAEVPAAATHAAAVERELTEVRKSLADFNLKSTSDDHGTGGSDENSAAEAQDDSTLLLMLRAWRAADEQLRAAAAAAAAAKDAPSKELEERSAVACRSEALDLQLAVIDEKHSHFRAMQQSIGALSGPALATELEKARKEGFDLGQRGLDNALAAARAEEAAQVRAEERARFDALLAQYYAEMNARQAETLASLHDDIRKEESLLVRAREEATAASSSLRERLTMDLDSAAVREANARRAASLEARALAMERARHEDEERRLLSRLTEAEEAARHAEASAKLQLERWKAEWSLAVAGRETALARNEAALSAARAVLEEEKRAHASSLSRLPTATAELEGARAEVSRLREGLAAAQRANEDGAAEIARLRKAAAEDAARLATTEARLRASEDACVSARAEAAAAEATARGSKEDWTAAVRMLRDRLAAAAAKVRAQEAALASLDREWRDKMSSTVDGEHAARAAAESAWAAERATLQAEASRAREEAAGESRRADEATAELAGERARCAELTKALGELRSKAAAVAAANSSSFAAGGGAGHRLSFTLAGGGAAGAAGADGQAGAGSAPSSRRNSLTHALGGSAATAAALGSGAGGLSSMLLAGLTSPLPSLPPGVQPSGSLAASQIALARAAEVLASPGLAAGAAPLSTTLGGLTSGWALGGPLFQSTGSAGASPTASGGGSGWASANSTPGRGLAATGGGSGQTGAPAVGGAALPPLAAVGLDTASAGSGASSGSGGARPPLPFPPSSVPLAAALAPAGSSGSTAGGMGIAAAKAGSVPAAGAPQGVGAAGVEEEEEGVVEEVEEGIDEESFDA